jgi:GNAT superfamily N-acetyltransferase
VKMNNNISSLDSERFGVTVMRSVNTAENAPSDAVQHARAAEAELLVFRCNVAHVRAAQDFERLGGRIMDTLLYFQRSAAALPGAVTGGDHAISIRAANPQDAEACAAVARESFKGYNGHYHADARLDADASTEVYASWAARSCAMSTVADKVFLAVEGAERIIGLSTVRRLRGGLLAEGSLDAVLPAAQRRGAYLLLNAARLGWCKEQGVETLEVSTHIGNRPAQRGLQRLGFIFDRAEYTFHLWTH